MQRDYLINMINDLSDDEIEILYSVIQNRIQEEEFLELLSKLPHEHLKDFARYMRNLAAESSSD